jgi:two-component system, NarL family, invasion response regulator UvrY
MTRVLIADDHAIVRYGTNLLVKEVLPEGIIQEAVTFEQMIQLLDTQPFDLLILDINIPGGNNLQMIDVVRLRQPAVKILIFSGYDEQLFAIRYLQAGANGYLMKHSPQSELKTAIQVILKNEIYASAEVKQHMLHNLSERKQQVHNPLLTLSDREMEVMQQLITGAPIASIAKSLNLQISTVSTYKTRVFEKLQVSNVVELVEKVRLYSNPG